MAQQSHTDRTDAELLRVSQICARLGLGRHRVYQLIAAGQIPSVRIGPRTIRVPRAAFDAYVAAQQERAVESLLHPPGRGNVSHK